MSIDLNNKVVLTIATTGAVTTRNHTPYVPITPEEIAEEVVACHEAGASVAHIHVREDDGSPSMNLEKFKEVVSLVRDRCDIVINLTSSGGAGFADEERMAPLTELLPELASFNAGTINWAHETIFENNPKFLEALGKRMQEVDVKPEIEVFDTGMIYNALYLRDNGFIRDDEPLHFQFVLGAPGGMAATIENLVHLKSLIPEDATWSAFGIGRMSVPILMSAAAMGGHLRVGMEDNIYIKRGQLANSNVEFVEQAKRIVAELGKEIATPDEARQILGLNKKV